MTEGIDDLISKINYDDDEDNNQDDIELIKE
jgi:hypothetical protein